MNQSEVNKLKTEIEILKTELLSSKSSKKKYKNQIESEKRKNSHL